jgi:DNA repair protein RadC
MKTAKYPIPGGEVRLMTVREIAAIECDTPEKAHQYWLEHVATSPRFHPDKENFVVLHLTTKRNITGFDIVSVGTLDSANVHPRETFRAAIVSNAHAIILMHNHPSGDPTPSDADIRVTRDLREAGKLLRIDVIDHVIVGDYSTESKPYTSLRELGYFY